MELATLECELLLVLLLLVLDQLRDVVFGAQVLRRIKVDDILVVLIRVKAANEGVGLGGAFLLLHLCAHTRVKAAHGICAHCVEPCIALRFLGFVHLCEFNDFGLLTRFLT